MKEIHIFRAGRQTAQDGQTIEFTAADMAASAAAYDPAKHEAPIVIGHPTNDAPAYGWVRTMRADGDDLYITPDQIDAAFSEMVAAGRYKKISANFYTPGSAANPVAGVYYLRHVGFLGAQPPAVRGLRQVQFADGADTVTVEFAEISHGDPLVETPPVYDSTVLDARAAELDRRETALRAAESAARNQRFLSFGEGLVNSGRLLPRHLTGLVAVLSALPDETVSFGEGAEAWSGQATAWLQMLLSEMPAQVQYGELTASATSAGPPATDMEIARRARTYHDRQQSSGIPISFAESVDAVLAGRDIIR